MLRKLQTHHNVGGLTFVTGLSFLTEAYRTASRAFLTPVSFLDWVPGVSAQHAWGLVLVVLGAAALGHLHIYVRAGALVLMTLTWSFFACAALFESVAGPQHHDIGSLFGLLATSITVACLRATAQIRHDYIERPGRDRNPYAR